MVIARSGKLYRKPHLAPLVWEFTNQEEMRYHIKKRYGSLPPSGSMDRTNDHEDNILKGKKYFNSSHLYHTSIIV